MPYSPSHPTAWRNPTVPWDHGMGWTVGHTCIVDGQVDIPWNVPLSHGIVGDGMGQFMVFLDIYKYAYNSQVKTRTRTTPKCTHHSRNYTHKLTQSGIIQTNTHSYTLSSLNGNTQDLRKT